MTLYLVRHGQTVWNLEKRRQGQRDSPLTEIGIGQATAIGRLLRSRIEGNAGIGVVSSPLGRALRTAELVCRELGFDPGAIRQDPQLMEADHGEWSGLLKTEIKPHYPEQWRRRREDRWNFRFPGGESYADLARRAAAWLAGLDADDGELVVVTHEMLSRCIRGSYLGLDPAQTLSLSHPQDRAFILRAGKVEELTVDAEPGA